MFKIKAFCYNEIKLNAPKGGVIGLVFVTCLFTVFVFRAQFCIDRQSLNNRVLVFGTSALASFVNSSSLCFSQLDIQQNKKKDWNEMKKLQGLCDWGEHSSGGWEITFRHTLKEVFTSVTFTSRSMLLMVHASSLFSISLFACHYSTSSTAVPRTNFCLAVSADSHLTDSQLEAYVNQQVVAAFLVVQISR